MMIKKYTYCAFMWVAFLVLLGHSIVRHHHHEDTHHTASHHHHDHEENQDLADLFSNFHHGVAGFEFSLHFDNIIEKERASDNTIFSGADLLSNQFNHFVLEEKVVKPPDIFSEIYSAYELCSSGLRGPPTFIV